MPFVQVESTHERFMRMVNRDDESGCWLWTGYLTPDGYGRFQLDFSQLAHRVAYILFVAEKIPDNLEIDHLCNVRHCVNPDHLKAVTRKDNINRSDAGGYQRRKTHCPQGHPYSPENTYISPSKRRHCRTCTRAAVKKYREKKKASTL